MSNLRFKSVEEASGRKAVKVDSGVLEVIIDIVPYRFPSLRGIKRLGAALDHIAGSVEFGALPPVPEFSETDLPAGSVSTGQRFGHDCVAASQTCKTGCLRKTAYLYRHFWIKGKNGESSWQLFGDMLEKYNISCTPGVGFGVSGDGYIRLTGFNSRENTLKAMKRICDGREK